MSLHEVPSAPPGPPAPPQPTPVAHASSSCRQLTATLCAAVRQGACPLALRAPGQHALCPDVQEGSQGREGGHRWASGVTRRSSANTHHRELTATCDHQHVTRWGGAAAEAGLCDKCASYALAAAFPAPAFQFCKPWPLDCPTPHLASFVIRTTTPQLLRSPTTALFTGNCFALHRPRRHHIRWYQGKDCSFCYPAAPFASATKNLQLAPGGS